MIAIIPKRIHAGMNKTYSLTFKNHNSKFHPGNKINMAFVNPVSEFNAGMHACSMKEQNTGGMKISAKIKRLPKSGVSAADLIQSLSVSTFKKSILFFFIKPFLHTPHHAATYASVHPPLLLLIYHNDYYKDYLHGLSPI